VSEISDRRLELLARHYNLQMFGDGPELAPLLKELQERRKGEYICPKCQLRQPGSHDPGDF